MLRIFVFEYGYYRLFHLNSNKGNYQGIPAAVVISLVQIIMLLDLEVIVFRIIPFHAELQSYGTQLGYFGMVLFVTFLIFNYKNYQARFLNFENRWGNQSGNLKSLRDLMLLILIIGPFFLLYILT